MRPTNHIVNRCNLHWPFFRLNEAAAESLRNNLAAEEARKLSYLLFLLSNLVYAFREMNRDKFYFAFAAINARKAPHALRPISVQRIQRHVVFPVNRENIIQGPAKQWAIHDAAEHIVKPARRKLLAFFAFLRPHPAMDYHFVVLLD